MASSMRTAGIVGSAIRELARMHYRDAIQHNINVAVLHFMRTPTSYIRTQIGELLETPLEEGTDRARFVLHKMAGAYDMTGILDKVPAYNNFEPEHLLRRELNDRSSSMPSKMIAVFGSEKVPDSRDSDAAYALGKKLAEAGVTVVCNRTDGILVPFLRGLTEHGGLTVGILPEENVAVHKNSISENSGLIKLPVVTPYGKGVLRTTCTAMSGRMILVLNGEHDLPSLRASMDAAYGGTHVLFVGKKPKNFPTPMEHPLQSWVSWNRAFKAISDTMFVDEKEEIDEAYNYLDRPHTPISILASTKSADKENVKRADTVFTEEVVRGLCALGCFPITGSGPGDMASTARIAKISARAARSRSTLTLGIAFFRTYLAINPYIDVPIIGNLKMERSDFMALSSVLSLNLGGSHATADEIMSVIQYGRPLVNCVNAFDSSFYQGLSGSRGEPTIIDAAEPNEAIAAIKQIIT